MSTKSLIGLSGHLLNFCHVLPKEEPSARACSTCRRNSEILSSQFSGGNNDERKRIREKERVQTYQICNKENFGPAQVKLQALLHQHLLCLLVPSGHPAYISRRQHVLWVDERPEQPHQLDSATQLGVRVTNHLLDHDIDQQNVLEN